MEPKEPAEAEPDTDEVQEKENSDSPKTTKRKKQTSTEEPVHDIRLRIEHAVSMVQMDDVDGAQALLTRVLSHELSELTSKEEKQAYYRTFVAALADEIVALKTVNMDAFPEGILSVDEEALQNAGAEDLDQMVKTEGQEVLQALARILKKNQNHYFLASKDYVMEHYSDCDLSLNSVAEAVGANSSYISRLFKEVLGISFIKFLTNCRIEHSLELLENKDIPIKDVASASGFNTIQNYMRIFKKYYGKTPGQYRDELFKKDE
jgi:AraC-like DNA-binding protein